jgi:Ribbon-helix-helix protein
MPIEPDRPKVRQLIREYIIEHAGDRELPAWLLKAATRKVTRT